jgi:hypothetical protein
VFAEFRGSSCAALTSDEQARVASEGFDLRFPDPGPFSYEGQFTPTRPGKYLICGYIDYSANSDATPPNARASQVVTVPPPPRRCVVPRLRGKTLKKAKAALKTAHCSLGKVTRKRNSKVKKGRVISQQPTPGTRKGSGFRVTVVLSRGRT